MASKNKGGDKRRYVLWAHGKNKKLEKVVQPWSEAIGAKFKKFPGEKARANDNSIGSIQEEGTNGAHGSQMAGQMNVPSETRKAYSSEECNSMSLSNNVTPMSKSADYTSQAGDSSAKMTGGASQVDKRASPDQKTSPSTANDNIADQKGQSVRGSHMPDQMNVPGETRKAYSSEEHTSMSLSNTVTPTSKSADYTSEAGDSSARMTGGASQVDKASPDQKTSPPMANDQRKAPSTGGKASIDQGRNSPANQKGQTPLASPKASPANKEGASYSVNQGKYFGSPSSPQGDQGDYFFSTSNALDHRGRFTSPPQASQKETGKVVDEKKRAEHLKQKQREGSVCPVGCEYCSPDLFTIPPLGSRRPKDNKQDFQQQEYQTYGQTGSGYPTSQFITGQEGSSELVSSYSPEDVASSMQEAQDSSLSNLHKPIAADSLECATGSLKEGTTVEGNLPPQGAFNQDGSPMEGSPTLMQGAVPEGVQQGGLPEGGSLMQGYPTPGFPSQEEGAEPVQGELVSSLTQGPASSMQGEQLVYGASPTQGGEFEGAPMQGGQFVGSPTQGGQFGFPSREEHFVGSPTQGGQFGSPPQGGQFGGSPTQGRQFGGSPTQGGQFGFPTQGGQFGSPTQGGQFGSPTQGGQFGSPTQRGQFGSPTQGGQFGTQGGQFGGSPIQGGQFVGSPTQGGQFGGSPTQGGQFVGSPTQGGQFTQFGYPTQQGKFATQGGQFVGSHTQGGQFGGYPTQGGQFGYSTQEGQFGGSPTQRGQFGYPTQGGQFGDSTTQGGQFGGSPTQGGQFGYPTQEGQVGSPTQGGQFGSPTAQGGQFSSPMQMYVQRTATSGEGAPNTEGALVPAPDNAFVQATTTTTPMVVHTAIGMSAEGTNKIKFQFQSRAQVLNQGGAVSQPLPIQQMEQTVSDGQNVHTTTEMKLVSGTPGDTEEGNSPDLALLPNESDLINTDLLANTQDSLALLPNESEVTSPDLLANTTQVQDPTTGQFQPQAE